MAIRHDEFLEAGAIIAAVVVDDPSQNAAMVEKLRLPFPILSDPQRELAITPYGVADPRDPREIAIPTTIVLDPAGNEVWRKESFDFAERPEEDTILDAVRSLGLPATTQQSSVPANAAPGPKAMPFAALTAYYRGAKFAAVAMSRRFPEAKENAKAYGAQMDRYIEAVHQIRD